ncbi:MAG: high-affinity nickel-transport family protein [Chloroflexi bacterium]|nr:high-affinity nickel-transport family protein [Chloroflexota bacterium]MBA3740245.1 high-affinity nickel-transport family protein [Chloroflexota bacterium]
MSQLLVLAGFGFLLGMRHATDADHVIAVTTILNRSRRLLDTTLIGALWGLGHTVTVVIVGVLIIVFNVVIPPALGLAMEFAVALMLIGLGILNLTGGLRALTERLTPPAPIHAHVHEHADASEHPPPGHAHLHGHGTDPHLGGRGSVVATFGWYQLLRPVVVGLVHGLAGSAAVALLVLATIQDTGTAVAYLVIFCIGVAAGMATLTTVIGLPLRVARARSVQINRWLTIGSGLLSLAVGLYLAYQIGFVDGLFTGDFRWKPA